MGVYSEVYSDSTAVKGLPLTAYCVDPLERRKTTHTCTHADMCMCTCMWGRCAVLCCAVVSLGTSYGRYHTRIRAGSTGHLNTTEMGARWKC